MFYFRKNTHTLTVTTMMSLLQMCIEYVCDNLHLVDTFYGFPETICEHIFQRCLEKKAFSLNQDPEIFRPLLNFFSESYSMVMCPNLNLDKEWKFLALYHDHLSIIFQCLQVIVFTHCKIGDGHAALQSIGYLQLLEYLDLSFNEITDKGVAQSLLLHARRSKKSLQNLKYVNLHGNSETSFACLKQFLILPNIHYVILDNCTENTTLFRPFRKNCKNYQEHFIDLKKKHTCDNEFSKYWSDKLLKYWRNEFEEDESARNTTKKTILAQSNVRCESLFYKKLKNLPLKSVISEQKNLKQEVLFCLCFYRNCVKTKPAVKRSSETHKNHNHKKIFAQKNDDFLIDMYS